MSAIQADLASWCEGLARGARAAARELALVPGVRKDAWLRGAADALLARQDEVLSANARDLAGAAAEGLTSASIDRLRLTPTRLLGCAQALRDVASLPDPVGQVREARTRPDGL